MAASKLAQHPVIHLSLSTAKGQTSANELRDKLRLIMKPYTEEYGSDPDEKTPGGMLAGLIRRAWKKSRKQEVETAEGFYEYSKLYL